VSPSRPPDILKSMDTTVFHFEHFEAFSPFSDVGPYRAADYWKLPEGEPVELIKGRLVVSPSPNVLHQTIIGILFEILSACARRTGSKVLLSPMDVILSDDTILQPDLLYIARARRHTIKQRVEGAPDLVAEIISGTSRRDRIEKLDLYAMYGVAEYWIVDPTTQLIEFLVNEKGKFVIQSATNDVYQSQRLPEVTIQVSEFWRQVDQQMSCD
jgi:Uma2 family endonuclease